LQARTLPALAGWSWISGGFALFRRNPPLMTALTMTYLLVMLFLNIVPLLGPVLVAVCLPVMSVIVFNGARILDENRAPARKVGAQERHRMGAQRQADMAVILDHLAAGFHGAQRDGRLVDLRHRPRFARRGGGEER
ncbi:hypothetical protein NK983_24025, partial [Salmonella enterica subsp. enterica serovar Typhimurium]|nr:hypothetical protein [Salmonella enterica subsp. enterica serovar Typhimurium]